MPEFINSVRRSYLRRRARRQLIAAVLLIGFIFTPFHILMKSYRESQERVCFQPTATVCVVAWADPPMYQVGQ